MQFLVVLDVNLDEATSALDYLTERTACENLRRELGRYCILYYPQLATIRIADSITLMEMDSSEVGSH